MVRLILGVSLSVIGILLVVAAVAYWLLGKVLDWCGSHQ